METWILGLLLANVIGISLGLMGGGGSVLALPILIYVMGVAPKSAIAMTLVIVGCSSLIGAIPHWRQGNVNPKIAVLFGPMAMVGAFLGAKLALLPFVSEQLQLGLFATVMALAAGLMIRRHLGGEAQKQDDRTPRTSVPARRFTPAPRASYRWGWLSLQGFGVGLLTGLVGVGGGFMIVPALVLLGGVPMHQAIGTSLVLISLNSAAGFLGYWGQVTLNWPLMISFIGLTTFGTVLGARLSRRLDSTQLQKGFGYFLLMIAGFILVQNLGLS
jgi:hypothetical protein